ncbi:unnamed protein product [Bursaphelenchus xylophilus]|uniref:(pine wood nematode) hypothetical protein n=1 Tax=Bursaphelenchus xylophilus TaxID=6326 RepID=A0A1I7S4D1_BURXY|nr:unnamed protein product [Bursaphelenchus xylophilus]CAG9116971.1 unnamed protein product [Bursaphelenchus xylophilus]
MPEDRERFSSVSTQTEMDDVKVKNGELERTLTNSQEKKETVSSDIASSTDNSTSVEPNEVEETEPSTSDKVPPDPEQEGPPTSKEIKQNKCLNQEGLSCFRFYTNAAHRNYTDFGDDAQLSERMLRFLLCSKRILFDVYGYVTIITAGRSSFFSSGWDVRYHTLNVKILAYLSRLIFFDDKDLRIQVVRQETEKCIDSDLVKLIYLAKKLDISLDIDEYFRTRVVDQLLWDVKLKTMVSYGYQTDYIHYGVDPVQLLKPDDFGRHVSNVLVNDIQRPYDVRPREGEVPDTVRRQKYVKVRAGYIADVLYHPCDDLNLKNVNFVIIAQYIPLPEMKKLKKLQAACKFEDFFDSNTFDLYRTIMADIKRAAPECTVDLSADVCINTRSYELQSAYMKRVGDAFQKLLALLRVEDNLFVQINVKTFLPLAEQHRHVEFFSDMSTITQFRNFRFDGDSWDYSATIDDPPSVDGNRRATLDLVTTFNDAVLGILGDKDFIVLE